jgi:hypothetical protein
MFFILLLNQCQIICQMNNNAQIPDELISTKIYFLRGYKVMLDRDLAELYQVTTGNLNKAVKRNLKRFPIDFMFQSDDQEFKNLIFQIGISSWGGIRTPPFAFTEQGVAMLSGILNSDSAIEVNIQIMRIFTKLREMYLDTTEIRLEIEKMRKQIENNSKNTELVFNYLDRLSEKVEEIENRQNQNDRKPIGYT